MAYRLACELPGRFDKIAVSGTLMFGFHVGVCQPSAPVSIAVLLGALDDTAPVEGRESQVSGDESLRMYSLDETLAFWAERNGCDPEAIQAEAGLTQYSSCSDDTTVTGYVLEGVGHNWPRTGDYALNQVGIDMATLITSYFMENSAPTNPTADTSTQSALRGCARDLASATPRLTTLALGLVM